MVHKAKSSCYIWTYIRNPHFIALAVHIKQLLFFSLVLVHLTFLNTFSIFKFLELYFIVAHLAMHHNKILLLHHFPDI